MSEVQDRLPAGAKDRLARVPMPERIARLRTDERGYPVPRFVLYINDKPDFRIMDRVHLVNCVKHKRCWVCGDQLGRNMTFVVGPMCIVNRTSAEPPSHLECGQYSARVCPFLAIPAMRRIEAHMPEGSKQAGIGIARNPGTICLWTVRDYRTFNANGVLFQMGEPVGVEWWREGRAATRDEVSEATVSGLPLLMAEAVKEGQAAKDELQKYFVRAQQYWPSELLEKAT